MWRVVHDYIKRSVAKWHRGVVSHNAGTVAPVDIHADDVPLAAAPKSTSVYRGVEDLAGSLAGVKV
jgi:hypothetical protein